MADKPDYLNYEENPWRIDSARYKFAPWLIVHCRRTETYYDPSDEGIGSLTGTTTFLSPSGGRFPYDDYVSGWSGGPVLTYWWKMSHGRYDTPGYSLTYTNRGSGGVANLLAEGTVSVVPAITLGTEDSLAVTTYDAGLNLGARDQYDYLYAPTVEVNGSSVFTAGTWFRNRTPTYDAGISLLLQTNLGGGAIGTYRGCWVYVTDTKRICVQFGDMGGAGYTNRVSYYTTTSAVTTSMAQFMALVVDPTISISFSRSGNPLFKLYVNGYELSASRSLGGQQGGDLTQASQIEWPTATASDYFGFSVRKGFGVFADLKDAYTRLDYDEPFIHFDEITANQILRMWQIGTTGVG